LPQILRRLQANQDSLRGLYGFFPHFVRPVLARCFADLVQPFSLLRFPPTRLSPLIDHSPFTAYSSLYVSSLITTDFSLDIKHLVTANSSFSVRFPSSRCDGQKSPSLCLPRDRCGSLLLHVVLSERASGDRPLPLPPLSAGRRPPGRVEAASGPTRIVSVCGMSTLDN
jgi:hypothetical protein